MTALLISLVVPILPATPAVAVGTFTVISSADSGEGTLRQAILDANATPNDGGPDQIVFAIGEPGTSHTIALDGALPAISEAVVIDGRTQASPWTAGVSAPLITVDGNGANQSGFRFDHGAGDPSGLYGLAIGGFDGGSGTFGVTVGVNAIVTIQSNHVGLAGDGTPLPNANGIQVASSGNTIGGADTGQGNVISGNAFVDASNPGDSIGRCCPDGHGLVLLSSAANNTVHGNLVGTDRTGTTSMGNEIYGIYVEGGSNQIGGPSAGQGNVISGNRRNLSLTGSGASGNVVMGNRIGTDATGTVALLDPANQSSRGIDLNQAGEDNWIGGPDGGGNQISGNSFGIYVYATSGTDIVGNLIGTDAAGSSAVPNSSQGIRIQAIGGTSALGNLVADNTISGNGGDGIWIASDGSESSVSGTIVSGNRIGTDVSGAAELGNDGAGVSVGSGLGGDPNTDNEIGGADPGAGNVIAFNGGDGVVIGEDHVRNTVSGNSIHDNGGQEIDLIEGGTSNPGRTANDELDSDIGGNELQNFPVITAADPEADTVTFNLETDATGEGSLESFTVELFASDACTAADPDAVAFRGSAAVQPSGTDGIVVDGVVMPTTLTDGEFLTATATDSDGNTSELSECFEVGGGPNEADLSTAITEDSGDPVRAGDIVGYTVSVTNAGPSDATNVSVTISHPDSWTPVALEEWCTSASTTTVVCNVGELGSGFVFDTGVSFQTNDTPGMYTITSTPSADQADPTPGNDVATVETTTELRADLEVVSITERFTEPIESGSDTEYTIQIRNNGPNDANGVQLTIAHPTGWSLNAGASDLACSAGEGDQAACSFATLESGMTADITVVFTTSGEEGLYDVTASLSATEVDPVGENDTFTATTELKVSEADLAVDITQATADPVYASDDVTYDVVVTNAGPDPATGIVVTLTHPADAAIANPGPCTEDGGTTLTCPVADLDAPGGFESPGEGEGNPSNTFQVTFTTPENPGSLEIQADVVGDQLDPANGNDSDTVTTTLEDPNPGFAPARRIQLEGGAAFVAVADLDGDEDDDLAVTNPDGGTVSILLNDGTGRVEAATPPTVAVGGAPAQIVAGDFDGDGNIDLVVNTEECTGANNQCGTLAYLAGNGDGTFDEPTTIDLDDHPEGLIAANVSGGPALDLVAANAHTGGGASDMTVLLGNGDGTFGTPVYVDADGGYHGVTHEDLTGDDNLDVVLAGGEFVTVYRGKGDGTFESAQKTSVGSAAQDPPLPVIADFDKDGYADVAVNGSAHVLFGVGNGTFRAAQVHLRNEERHVAVVAPDVNGDGSPDLILARKDRPTGEPALRGHFGKGDGTFDPGDDAFLKYPATDSLATGDLNGDGKPDLIVPNTTDSRITILLGNAQPLLGDVTLDVVGANTAEAGFSSVDVDAVDLGSLELGEGELEGAGGPEAAPTKRQPTKRQPTKRQPTKRQGSGFDLPSVLEGATLGDLVAHPLGDRYTVLLTEIVPDGGWRTYLPAALSATPLQEISLDDVITLPAVQDIPIDAITLPTSLDLLPPGAWLFGETTLAEIVPAGTTVQSVLDAMAIECTLDGLAGSSTLVDVALRRCPLDAIPWDDIHLVDVDLSTSLLHHFNFSGIDPSKVEYEMGGSVASMEDLLVADLPAGIVKSTCPAPCDTLADVEAKLDSYEYEDGATFGMLLDASNAGDLLGEMTLRQLLPGLIDPADFPYELVDVDELIGAIRPTSDGAITYRATVEIRCDGAMTDEVSVTAELPSALFRYVRSSMTATLGGAPITVDEPAVNGAALTFTLPPNPCSGASATLVLHFDVQPAPSTGVFTSSITATVGAGFTVRTNEVAGVTLTEANAPNDDPDTAPELDPDTLYFGQLSSPTDVNYYRIPLEAGDVGQLLVATLSNAAADLDLLLYGPPAASQSLRAAGTSGIGAAGLGDQDGCLPAGYVLEAQSLQDVPQLDPAESAVRGFSSNRSDYAEVVCTVVQEADVDAGFLTLQVSGFEGPVADPHLLRYALEEQLPPASCLAPTFPHAGSTLDTMPTDSQVQAASTYILINEERLASMYGQQALLDLLDGTAATGGYGLRDLAADEDGVIIPVELDAGVAAAYTALEEDDEAACSPERQNAIVREINELVDSLRGTTQPDHVVVIGSDAQIPFARVQDLTTLGNQVSYAAELRVDGADTPVSRAFGRGLVLTDDAYVGYAPVPWVGNPVYLPASAIGRLVETPGEMLEQIDAFNDSNGVLAPDTALVSGADFSRDVARAIATNFEGVQNGGQPAFDVNRKLAPRPSDPFDWSREDMLCQLKGNPASTECSGDEPFGVPGTADEPGLISVNGHFSHYATETGDNGLLTTADFSPLTLPRGTLLFTIGCNSGVSVDDTFNDGNGDEPEALDWAQALAQKNGVLVANTGYGYGDTNTIAFSERLMLGFSEQMFTKGLDGNNVSIGQALAYSKTLMFSGLGVYTPYDIKAIEEATLYGLPMYRMGTQAEATTTEATPPTLDPDTGLQASDLTVNDFVKNTRDRKNTGRGSYFVGGPTGSVTSVPGYPVQPVSEPFDMTVPGRQLHDALVTELTVDLSLETEIFDPVYSTALLDGGIRFAEDPLVSEVVFPTSFTNATSSLTVFGRRDFLVLFGGKFTSNPLDFVTGTGTQRIHNDMKVRAFYSNDDDRTRPTISNVQGVSLPGDLASFTVNSPSTDVAAVYLTYRREPNTGVTTSTFRTFRLPEVSTGTYRGTISQLPQPIVEYFVQVVDRSGNVGLWQPRNVQGGLLPAAPPPAGVNVTITGTKVNGWYDAGVTVQLSGGFQTFQYRVDGGPLTGYTPGSAVPVPAAGGTLDGVHTFAWEGSYRTSNTEYIPIDGAPPVIDHQIEQPKHVGTETWIGPNSRVLLDVYDTGSGVGSCTIQVDGPTAGSVPCVAGLNPVSFAGRTDGRYTITVDAADNVGGAGHTAQETIEVIYDTKAPDLGFDVASGPDHTNPTTSRRYVRSDSTLRLTVEDTDVATGVPGAGVDTCGLKVSYGATEKSTPTCSSSQTNQDFSLSPDTNFTDGTHHIDATARDRVTNASSARFTVVLDNTEPQVGTSIASGPQHTDGTGRRYITSATVVRVAANDPAAPDTTPGSGVNGATCDIELKEKVDGTTRNRACAEGNTDVTLAPGEPDGPPGSATNDPTFDDAEYTVKTTAPDNVTNVGTDTFPVALDNTAPIFGACPTPVPDVSGSLVSNISATATSFVVDELATSPRTPFEITVDNERMRVTKKALVAGTTSRWTYTVTRGFGGTTRASHLAAAAVSWVLETRNDLLATVSANATATATSIQVNEERFGVPALPFIVTIGTEDLRITARTRVGATGSTYNWTVERGVRGTTKASISAGAEARWTEVVAAVYLNSTPKNLTITAQDPNLTDGVPGAGLATADSTLTRTLQTDQVGTFTLGYTAKDRLGNTRLKDCTYEVIYMFSGFFKPVNTFGVNSANPGSGQPMKWKITDANGAPITTDDSFRSVTSSGPITPTSACSTKTSFAVLAEGFKGGSSLQNFGDGNFQFNWAIPSDYKGSCRTVAVRLFAPGLTPDIPPAGFVPSRRYQYTNFQIKNK